MTQDTSMSKSEVQWMPPRAAGGNLKAPSKCLICAGSRHRVVFREFGTTLLRCSACGHVFSSHLFVIARKTPNRTGGRS
jgi:hypothetical protein